MPTIYLSPSLQPYNLYVGGETNEQAEMNRIADAMEPYLRTNDITFSRNTVGTSLGQAIRESNAGDYDLHLALHSNAAPESLSGKIRGTDVYYYEGSAQGKRAAEIIAENFKKIYPDPSKVRAVPTTQLVEVTKTNAPAVLMEIAYHDNTEDADWILANTDKIAENIVEALTIYFGIPFISPPEQPQKGTVITQNTSLNIREKPSTESAVIGSVPKGAEITVNGEWNGWYAMEYQGIKGYVSAQYVRLQ